MDNSEAVRKHQQIMSQQALFERHVQALKKNLSDIELTVVSSAAAFPPAHHLAAHTDSARKAAMTASLGGLSTSVSEESGLKSAVATTIECEDGLVFSRHVTLDNEKSVELLVACSRHANYAAALWTIKKTINDIIEDFNRGSY